MLRCRIFCQSVYKYDVNSIYYEKVSEWPICVKSCPRKLTYIPRNETGLIGIVPPNTIPSGQFGSYICIDSTLGVNQVGAAQCDGPFGINFRILIFWAFLDHKLPRSTIPVYFYMWDTFWIHNYNFSKAIWLWKWLPFTK